MTSDKGILIKNIYYMLAYAFQELRQNNYKEIDGENFIDIYDLFAEILAKGISFQLKQGLHREYIHKKESRTTLRGKIDLNETISLRTRNSNLVGCEYDELSENNIYNRIIITTVNILLRHADVKKAKKASLRKLMLFFSNVQPIALKDIHWNLLRLDQAAQVIYRLRAACSIGNNQEELINANDRFRRLLFEENSYPFG